MAALKSGMSYSGKFEPPRAASVGRLDRSFYAHGFRTSGNVYGSGIFGGGGDCRQRMMITMAKKEAKTTPSTFTDCCDDQLAAPKLSNGHSAFPNGTSSRQMATIGKSSNIMWHECSVKRTDRQHLLQQKGCVVWITGLSGSGKSTVACALSRVLHTRGKLTYVLDGDNVRHGLNSDLSFRAEDRVENIRRIGEVAKLFADSGVICIASLISPYRKDRDACRAMLPEGEFIEVFMDVPLEVCELRDPKGLYKRARAGEIKGFTGIDDPYERPLNCEVTLSHQTGDDNSPIEMAEAVVSYLEEHGYLQP